MRRILAISGFVLIMAAATNLMARPHTTRFIDSGSYSLDGSNWSRTYGAAQLWTDGNLWILSKHISGPRTGKVDWQNAFAPPASITAYDPATCQPKSVNFIGLGPYEDSSSLSLCTWAGALASANCGTFYSGTYRPLGDAGLPANQGGQGARAGVALYDANGGTWVLAIKTANSVGGGVGWCSGAGLAAGPGAVNQWVLIPLATNL